MYTQIRASRISIAANSRRETGKNGTQAAKLEETGKRAVNRKAVVFAGFFK